MSTVTAVATSDDFADETALDFSQPVGSDFWTMFVPFDGPPLITIPERDDIINHRAVVEIRKIRQQTTKYGPAWFVEIAHTIYGNEREITVVQADNMVRSRVYGAMLAYMKIPDEQRQPIFARMERFDTPEGEAYKFVALDDEPQQAPF